MSIKALNSQFALHTAGTEIRGTFGIIAACFCPLAWRYVPMEIF